MCSFCRCVCVWESVWKLERIENKSWIDEFIYKLDISFYHFPIDGREIPGELLYLQGVCLWLFAYVVIFTCPQKHGQLDPTIYGNHLLTSLSYFVSIIFSIRIFFGIHTIGSISFTPQHNLSLVSFRKIW